MDARIGELWDEYRGAARALYEGSDDGLRLDPEGTELVGVLESAVEASERLGDELASRLPGNRRERGENGVQFDPDHETVALVAAAIDVAVAADVFDALAEEKERARSEGSTVPPLVELAALDPDGREPVQALLDEADGLFPEREVGRGSAPWPPTADEEAKVGIARLIESGTPVATSCGVGLLTLGVTDLIGAVGGFKALETVARSVGGHVRLALRLLRSGVAKILAVVGAGRLIEAAVDFSTHQALDVLASRSRIDRWAVSRLVRESESLILVDEALASHTPDEAVLETLLEQLCRDYDRNMKWGRRYATALKFAGPGVVLLGFGPPGAAGMAAANGIGLTYALFSLSDRLDTSPFLSMVDGVPTRVRTA